MVTAADVLRGSKIISSDGADIGSVFDIVLDDEHWPVMTQSQWGLSLHQYYNRTPYWVRG